MNSNIQSMEVKYKIEKYKNINLINLIFNTIFNEPTHTKHGGETQNTEI